MVYRFQYKGVNEADLVNELPPGTFVLVALANPAVTVDVTLAVPAGDPTEADLIAAMHARGWVHILTF